MSLITQSNWIVQKRPWHANMTERNHLGSAMLIKPQVIYPKVMSMFAAQTMADNPLLGILSNIGMEETVDTREYQWDLRGATARPLVLMETVASAQGKNRSEFELVFDENFWNPGDVVSPGNPDVQARIQGVSATTGKTTTYRLRLNEDSVAKTVAVKYLKQGTKWNKLFSQYEEGAEQGGSTVYNLPMTLSNRLSRYRKTYKVTGDARNEGVLAVKLPDANGKLHDTWIGYNEAEFWYQWARELSIGQWYSKSTNTVMGSTNRPVFSGPGIHELLKYSPRHHYNKLSGRLISEFILDQLYGRISPSTVSNLVGFSGEYGMMKFHEVVMNDFKNTGFITVDSNFIERTNSPFHKNALAYGAQFTVYRMANNRTFTMMHNPLYDDFNINHEINPATGFPYESGRITILDITGQGANANVRLTRLRNAQKIAYVHGTTGPFGPVQNGSAAHTGDYYQLLIEDSVGSHIDDVTRCGELIPNRAA